MEHKNKPPKWATHVAVGELGIPIWWAKELWAVKNCIDVHENFMDKNWWEGKGWVFNRVRPIQLENK